MHIHTHTHEHTNWSYCIAKHVLLFKPGQNISDLRNYTKRPFEVANDPPFWACKSSKFSCSLTSSLKNATMQQVCDMISNGSILAIFWTHCLVLSISKWLLILCNNTAVFGLTWLNSAARGLSLFAVKVRREGVLQFSRVHVRDVLRWHLNLTTTLVCTLNSAFHQYSLSQTVSVS